MESVFRKSNNKYVIEEIALVLDRHSIVYKIIDNEKDFVPSFISDPGRIQYQLLISDIDFEIANKTIQDYYANDVVIPEGYYLLEYSNKELNEILFKKDEWNEFDYEAAKKILTERGEKISDDEIKIINNIRLESLRNDYENPKEVKNYITFGYIFAIIGCILSLAWGSVMFISYAIAIAIIRLKKQLPNGERVHYFNEKDRNHGKRILWISIVFTIFWVVIIIIKN